MTLLSTFWRNIQQSLFPFLEDELGPLSDTHRRLVAVLEIIRIEEFIPLPRSGYVGRPPENLRPLARAFVAKVVFNLPTTDALIEYLKNDARLRRICGWQWRTDVPSKASFSRACTIFSATALPAKVHAALIEKHEAPRLVGHLSRDSTAIVAREKPAPTPRPKKDPEANSEQKKRQRGRPKNGVVVPPKEPTRLERQAAGMNLEAMVAELPTVCNTGSKTNSKGYKETWRGYKLHIDWADGEVPISCILSSASLHDSQAAIPLMRMSAQRVTSLYDLMDAAYDAPPIKMISRALGHVPIIDSNPRRGEKQEMDPATKLRYRERTTAERGNSQLKDNFGGRTVRVRGHVKVFAHLMFGILALTAEQLLRLVQ